jgi:hypothetical protein
MKISERERVLLWRNIFTVAQGSRMQTYSKISPKIVRSICIDYVIGANSAIIVRALHIFVDIPTKSDDCRGSIFACT